MIVSSCPRCSRKHLSDEAHTGKMLRCAGCGDPVAIGFRSPSVNAVVTRSNGREFGRVIGSASFHVSELVGRRKKAFSTCAWVIATIFVLCLITGSLMGVGRTVKATADPWAIVSETPANEATGPSKDSGLKKTRAHGYDTARTSGVLPDSLDPDAVRPATGEMMAAGPPMSGQGTMSLINGSVDDAVVVLVGCRTGHIVRSIFVRSRETAVISNIDPGQYSVRVTKGKGWNSGSNEFIKEASYFAMSHLYTFNEINEGDRIVYDRMSLTLHEVANGNVQRYPISKQAFWAETASD